MNFIKTNININEICNILKYCFEGLGIHFNCIFREIIFISNMRYINFYSVFQKLEETICHILPYYYLCKLNQPRYRATMLIK